MISGSLDVPLDLSDPEKLSDEFYTQSVKGSLIIQPTPISRFKSALEKFEITGTEGIISFDGTLSGTAGTPNFEGSLNIDDPVLSNVTLDSVFADFKYSQEQENIIINTEVLAARQKAADIDIDFPFSYNFKTFELNTVDESKPVSVEVRTRDFNLAVFNDFVNKEFTRNLKGVLKLNSDGDSEYYNLDLPLGDKADQSPLGLNLITALLFAFLGGLILNAMPCVFPILSIKILGFIEQSQGSREKMMQHGFVFSAGVLTTFLIVAGLLLFLRSTGDSIGWGYQMQSPLIISLLIYLFSIVFS